jgi:uncharacterized protein (TIGR00369 family)
MTDASPTTTERPRSNLFETLGFEIIEQRDGYAELRCPVLDEYTIGNGQLQGGFYAVMLDAAMAVASEGQLSTATLQINLLRPAFTGQQLTVTGEVVRKGRRVLYAEGEVRGEDGKLIARGNQTGLPLRLIPLEAEGAPPK